VVSRPLHCVEDVSRCGLITKLRLMSPVANETETGKPVGWSMAVCKCDGWNESGLSSLSLEQVAVVIPRLCEASKRETQDRKRVRPKKNVKGDWHKFSAFFWHPHISVTSHFPLSAIRLLSHWLRYTSLSLPHRTPCRESFGMSHLANQDSSNVKCARSIYRRGPGG